MFRAVSDDRRFGAARKLLAKFDAGLVKRIDAVESTEHRGLVFVECHQRPQTSRIKLINADRGYSIEAVSFFTRDQRFGLSLGVGNQYAVQVGVTVTGLFAPQEIN